MPKKKITKVTLVISVFILVVVTAGVFWRMEQNSFQETLSLRREEAKKHLSYSSQASVAPEYRDQFERCEEMSRYDHFVARQPSDLTDEEIEEAVSVSEKCASHFPDKRDFSYQKVGESLKEMEKLIAEQGGFDNKEEAVASDYGDPEKAEFIDVWESIDDVLKTQAETFTELGSIQEDYFRVERDLRRGEISSEEREEEFGRINEKANESLDLMQEKSAELKELKQKEEKVWEDLLD
ncbi:MAG: hypothetical protein ACLFTS_02360 [Candidatus Paceibacterota bacterium]